MYNNNAGNMRSSLLTNIMFKLFTLTGQLLCKTTLLQIYLPTEIIC